MRQYESAMHARSVAQLCLTLETPWSGSSVYGILKARILDWVAMPSSRGSLWPKDQTHGSWIDKQFLYHWATWEAHEYSYVPSL